MDQIHNQRLVALEQQLFEARENYEKLSRVVESLQFRLLGKNRHRWDVVEKVADYFMGAQVVGDYAEFGVYQGETFAHACKHLGTANEDMKFWAFDSFEGLPLPKAGIDKQDGYSGGFYEGQFACSEAEFIENLKTQKVDLTRVITVAGWYDDTLRPDFGKSQELKKIAFAWVDCDLYESTIPVLDYLTPRLSVGSVILFDDWRCFRNLSDRGQQKACREWLERNPQISLNLLIDNDYNGYAFSVASC